MRLFDHIDANFERYVHELQEYCRQPSIAAQNIGMAETAAMVKGYMDRLGFTTRLYPLEGGYPVIYGELKGRGEKSLLFYQHYDVQPPEPLELWTSPPFSPEIRDGYLYARGVSDNKGDTMARLKAIEAWQAVCGELPLTIKFLVEGEEEIGSPHLGQFLEEHQEMLRSDYCIWEGGMYTHRGVPTLSLGMKGMYYAELEAKGANQDVHSAWGTVVPNPAWRLVWALGTLKGPDERIRIDGFYDDAVPPTADELEHLKSLPDVDDLKQALGLDAFVLNVDGLEAVRRDRYEPTCTIDGIVGGYTGPGAKTVIGNWARAKIDFRLVTNMDPDDVRQKLRAHLDRHGFSDITITSLSGARGYRVSMDAPEAITVREVLREVNGMEPIVIPTNKGSGPIYDVHRATGANPMAIGVSNENSRFHAPDENIALEHYRTGIKVIAALIGRLGGCDPDGAPTTGV